MSPIEYPDARRWGVMASYDPTEPSKEATSTAEHWPPSTAATTSPLDLETLQGQQADDAASSVLGLQVGAGVAVAFILTIILIVALVCLVARIHSYIMRRNFLQMERDHL